MEVATAASPRNQSMTKRRQGRMEAALTVGRVRMEAALRVVKVLMDQKVPPAFLLLLRSFLLCFSCNSELVILVYQVISMVKRI